ncbi:MAG: ribosome maturation factor RimP [Deferrisomatales bacterium]|nr:ribosome maturation factor RimP [Deferrisomatales bacterium]
MEDLLRPVAEDLGYELVDVQLQSDRGRRVLRLLFDRPGGITLDECTRLSREMSPHLEVADPIPGAYVMEVSSPGVQRPLRRAEDFERFRDQQVVVGTRETVEGRKTFRGVNRGMDDEGNLKVDDAETGRSYTVPLDLVRAAHLDPKLPF